MRLLFCLFAEDTGLFGENSCFLALLANETQADGSDLHGELTALFDTLNRPIDAGKRPKNLPERLAAFPYVNGALFKDTLAQCYFDEAARNNTLIDCAKLDWSVITPSIFGSLLQAIMHFDDEAATAKTKNTVNSVPITPQKPTSSRYQAVSLLFYVTGIPAAAIYWSLPTGNCVCWNWKSLKPYGVTNCQGILMSIPLSFAMSISSTELK